MQRNPITLHQALDFFLLDCESRRLTKSTQTFYKAKLGRFVRFCEDATALGAYKLQPATHLHEITKHHIRAFQVHLQAKDLTAQYQHNLSRAIRAWFRFCVRDEIIDALPKVNMPKLPKHDPLVFTDQEVTKIVAACTTDRDRALCLFLLDSGVRASEALALNIGDVDMKTGAVSVRNGKGQKDRVTYIGSKTRKGLAKYLLARKPDPNAPLFYAIKRGRRLTLSGLVQIMKRLRKATGIKHCTAHTWRRTFATSCLRNGMNIYVLAKLMGHADVQTLLKYLRLVEDDLQKSQSQHGVVDNL